VRLGGSPKGYTFPNNHPQKKHIEKERLWKGNCGTHMPDIVPCV
jgi:hypothetical protein